MNMLANLLHLASQCNGSEILCPSSWNAFLSCFAGRYYTFLDLSDLSRWHSFILTYRCATESGYKASTALDLEDRSNNRSGKVTIIDFSTHFLSGHLKIYVYSGQIQ